MRATVEYDKNDVAKLICRDILTKFGIKLEPQDVMLTTSKHDSSIVYELDLNTGKKEQAK